MNEYNFNLFIIKEISRQTILFLTILFLRMRYLANLFQLNKRFE